MSYQKISVLFNLYLQGGLLLISSLLPLMASLFQAEAHPSSSNILISLVLLVYAALYGVGSILLYRHYPPHWDASFWRCVNDLKTIAARLHLSYQTLNLLVFVVLWLALLSANLLLCYHLLTVR